jgi:hypothetical protein
MEGMATGETILPEYGAVVGPAYARTVADP